MKEKIYKNAKGNTKYYASYTSAWNAANKLNEKLSKDENPYYFEMDLVGWYLFQDAEVGA